MASPYNTGFLANIAKINFGSAAWFGVVGPRGDDHGEQMSMVLSFPDQAAGTPGFTPVISNGGGHTPIVFAPYVFKVLSFPYTITAADLAKTLVTGAGGLVDGFALGGVDAAGGVMMLFKIDKLFPDDPFRVRIQFPGNTTHENVGVFTVAGKSMKAGIQFSSSFDLPQVSALYPDIPAGVATDFLISPTTLAVTQE